jgi:hypothetical protein
MSMKQDYEEESLRAAKEDLRTTYDGLVAVVNERGSGDHRHISAKHKMETSLALLQLTASYQIAARGDSLEIVQAVKQAMTGTFFIVWHCGASPAAKKFFDNQDHGPGGQKSGVTKKINAAEWRDKAIKWLDGRTGKSLALKKGVTLAKACKKAIDIQIGQKGLAEFFNLELKRRDHANKVVPIRA